MTDLHQTYLRIHRARVEHYRGRKRRRGPGKVAIVKLFRCRLVK